MLALDLIVAALRAELPASGVYAPETGASVGRAYDGSHCGDEGLLTTRLEARTSRQGPPGVCPVDAGPRATP